VLNLRDVNVMAWRYGELSQLSYRRSSINRRSKGVHWVHVHTQGGEKNSGAKFTVESCKCTPRQSVPPEAKQECIFRGNWGDLGGGKRYLSMFSLCFKGDE